MWKAFMAVALSGFGAFVGGQVALRDVDQSVLDDGVLTGRDVEAVALYSLYGATGLPLVSLLGTTIVTSLSSKAFQGRLQKEGVAAIEELGFGGDVGVAVSQVLGKIER